MSRTAPWAERIDGARRAERDAHHAVQVFVAEHLTELIAEREQAGAEYAAELAVHTEGIIRAHRGWQNTAGEINQLATLAGGRVHPGDVSRSSPAADQLYAAAEELIRAGGEQGPVLHHDPRQPRHGQIKEPEPMIA